MRVTWSITDSFSAPPPTELAWQYALDLMLSDAHNNGIEHLRCISAWQPIAGLVPDCRDTEQDPPPPSRSSAAAFLGTVPDWPPGVRTVYVFERTGLVHHGRPIPANHWDIRERYYVHTHAAKLFGAVMRVGALLNRPDIEDRGIFGVRDRFVSTASQPSSYRLVIWDRIQGGYQ